MARFNSYVTEAMLTLARDTLVELGVSQRDIKVAYVPGAFELASGAQAMLCAQHYDAMICFGCVMKGETRHDVVVSDAAAQGIQRLALEKGLPIIFGVICAENREQARARIVRGRECAEAAVEMAQLFQHVSTSNNKERETEVCLQGSLKN